MNVNQGSITFLMVIIFLAGFAVLALCIYCFPEIAVEKNNQVYIVIQKKDWKKV
jgi:hypothetical protein